MSPECTGAEPCPPAEPPLPRSAATGSSALDPVIHAQPRLRLVLALSSLDEGDRITFPRLQSLLGMTPGNHSTHLRRLEDAGYVSVEKSFRHRSPVTSLALARKGQRALEDYTTQLQGLLAASSLSLEPTKEEQK